MIKVTVSHGNTVIATLSKHLTREVVWWKPASGFSRHVYEVMMTNFKGSPEEYQEWLERMKVEAKYHKEELIFI